MLPIPMRQPQSCLGQDPDQFAMNDLGGVGLAPIGFLTFMDTSFSCWKLAGRFSRLEYSPLYCMKERLWRTVAVGCIPE